MDRGTRHHVALGLLGAACLVGILGLLLSWWTVTVRTDDAVQFRYVVGPYGSQLEDLPGAVENDPDVAESLREFNEGLDGEALLAGILATVALVATVAAVTLFVVAYFAPRLARRLLLLPAGLAALVGVSALILAPVTWPGAWDDHLTRLAEGDEPEFHASWWGSDAPPDSGGQRIEYGAAPGWYLSIVAFVVLPAIAGALALRPPAPAPLPPRTVAFAPAAAPPPLPPPAARGAPAPAPVVAARDPSAPRRIRVVNRPTKPVPRPPSKR